MTYLKTTKVVMAYFQLTRKKKMRRKEREGDEAEEEEMEGEGREGGDIYRDVHHWLVPPAKERKGALSLRAQASTALIMAATSLTPLLPAVDVHGP
jgi:hypothetical protein